MMRTILTSVTFIILQASVRILPAQEYFEAREPMTINLAEQAVGQGGQNRPATTGGNSSMVVTGPGSSGAAGFAGSSWGTSFSNVKNMLKNLATSAASPERVEILMEERNRYILVRRNDVLYRYSFYKTPLEVQRLANHQRTADEYEAEEGLLYHVKVTMPMIDAELIKGRLEEVYRVPATKSTVDKTMRGAAIWELSGTLVFQWYEPYRNKAFTRTIDYLGRELAEKIMKEYADYFDAKEKAILKEMLLQ